MVLMRRQAQLLIAQFKNLNFNTKVLKMAAAVNYILCPFEGNINTRYPQRFRPYMKATKEIEKEADKLDISVSNTK